MLDGFTKSCNEGNDTRVLSIGFAGVIGLESPQFGYGFGIDEVGFHPETQGRGKEKLVVDSGRLGGDDDLGETGLPGALSDLGKSLFDFSSSIDKDSFDDKAMELDIAMEIVHGDVDGKDRGSHRWAGGKRDDCAIVHWGSSCFGELVRVYSDFVDTCYARLAGRNPTFQISVP